MPRSSAAVPHATFRRVQGGGLLVTGLTKADILAGQRARAKQPQNGHRALQRKQELLWSLAVRLVRKGKIRNRAKKVRKKK
jgi:hypothetical protein